MLGPILFLVYVNSLTIEVDSIYDVFADYYKVYLHYQRGAEPDGMAVLQNLNR